MALDSNRNDVTQLEPLIDSIGPVRGKRGRPRKRPDALYGDRAYDYVKHRRVLRRRGVKAIIAHRRGHGSGLGRLRWVVERTFSWLHGFRRLRIRYERSGASTSPSWCSARRSSVSGSCAELPDRRGESSDDV
jgi:transposase